MARKWGQTNVEKIVDMPKGVMFLPIMSMASSNYFVVHLLLVKLKVFVAFVAFVSLTCLNGMVYLFWV